MINPPDFELYNYLYEFCDSNYDTYDYLPLESENAAYPFVEFGDTQLTGGATKYALNGDVSLTINVWCDANDRYTINKIINDIYHEAINIEETNNYRVSFDIQRSDTQVLTDTSVENTILLHGILDLHFKIL